MIRRLLDLDGAPSTHSRGQALFPHPNPRVESVPEGVVRVAEPCLGAEEQQAVAEVMASGFISSASPVVASFEERLAECCGTTEAIAVTCGTHALDLLMHCFEVGPGDEVIVPAFAFISVGACVARAGARPVFVDVEPSSLNMLPGDVEAAVSPRTRGVIAVHTYGHPAHMDELRDIADRHGIFLLEDACEGLGARVGDQPAGGLGDVAVHSFYANKMMTTGNGGAITTSHSGLAELLRKLRGYSYATNRFFWHGHMPFNVRMSAMQAAVGQAQVQRLEAIVAQRQEMAERYAAALGGISRLTLPGPALGGRHAYWMYTIHVDEHGPSAGAVREALAAAGIETRPAFTPLHVQPVLQDAAAPEQGPFPTSEWAARTGINLPSGSHVGAAEVARVARVLRAVLGENEA